MSDKLSAGQTETLRDLQKLAGPLHMEGSLTLIGATARLLQLDWPLGLLGRATADVDFVARLGSWDEHKRLMVRALTSGFESCAQEHRLRHSATRTFVDIVPIGGMENPTGIIRWPDSHFEMSVWGMHESQLTADTLIVAPDLAVRVVALPLLVALKLVAWMDRKLTDKGQGDLADANSILSHCHELPQFESNAWDAYEEASQIAKRLGKLKCLTYSEHAGAALIGRELRDRLLAATKKQLIMIIEPIARDPYHSAIDHLLRPAKDIDGEREIISLRFAILKDYIGD